MKYRRFGQLDWEVSALGFGGLRFPLTTPRVSRADEANVNEDEAIRLVRYAIDHGVNYVDSGYPYHEGHSEIVIGKALQNGYRDKIRLSTKCAVQGIKSREHLDTVFQEELTKLQTDHLDFYLLGGIGDRQANSWARVQQQHLVEWAEQQMDAGTLHHLGFSYHGHFEPFKKILDDYDGWTFCYIQYNYLDTESCSRTPGTQGLKYAAEKGLAIGTLEPIQGGNLATKSPVRPTDSPLNPGEIQTLLAEAGITRTPADLALQWVWNHPEVSVALSGMGAMNQVMENVDSANRSPEPLTEQEVAFISKIRALIDSRLS